MSFIDSLFGKKNVEVENYLLDAYINSGLITDDPKERPELEKRLEGIIHDRDKYNFVVKNGKKGVDKVLGGKDVIRKGNKLCFST